MSQNIPGYPGNPAPVPPQGYPGPSVPLPPQAAPAASQAAPAPAPVPSLNQQIQQHAAQPTQPAQAKAQYAPGSLQALMAGVTNQGGDRLPTLDFGTYELEILKTERFQREDTETYAFAVEFLVHESNSSMFPAGSKGRMYQALDGFTMTPGGEWIPVNTQKAGMQMKSIGALCYAAAGYNPVDAAQYGYTIDHAVYDTHCMYTNGAHFAGKRVRCSVVPSKSLAADGQPYRNFRFGKAA